MHHIVTLVYCASVVFFVYVSLSCYCFLFSFQFAVVYQCYDTYSVSQKKFPPLNSQ